MGAGNAEYQQRYDGKAGGNMRLGLIGRGPWGNVYAKTLAAMGVEFKQFGRDWLDCFEDFDGVIIASAPESHFLIAESLLNLPTPILIEKPVCTDISETRSLLQQAEMDKRIVFCSHTRLYDPRWRSFKAKAMNIGVRRVYAEAGGPCKIDRLWDWGPHLVAMCLDIGFSPLKADIRIHEAPVPLRFVVNERMEFNDAPVTPTPLEVMLTEFMAAITKGEPNYKDLELAVKVTSVLEAMEATCGA